MSTSRPDHVGSYEIVATLAQGGMGVVYLARRNGIAGFRRFFAVKQLHPRLACDPAAVAMFVDEARLAARIHHPNVVPVIDLGDADDGYFVVMDYVEGASASRLGFAARRANRSVPVPVVLRIVLDALAGLHAAHELTGDDGEPLSLVHRDVSPQNIMIGTDGVARLIDFGIARAAVVRAACSAAGMVKGKPAYMAPEQIECGELDRRTDLYAMGIVLSEMLTGSLLFDRFAQIDRLSAARVRERVADRLAEARVPPELRAVCMRALQHARERRFQSATAFSLALRMAAAGAGERGIATREDVAQCLTDLLARSLERVREAIRALPRAAPRRPPAVDLSPADTGDVVTVAAEPARAPAAVLDPPGPLRFRPARALALLTGAVALIVLSSALHGARALPGDRAVAQQELRGPATPEPSSAAPPPPAETSSAVARLESPTTGPSIAADPPPPPRDRPAPRMRPAVRPPPPVPPEIRAFVAETSGTAAFGGRL